jgi:hypothetical protein
LKKYLFEEIAAASEFYLHSAFRVLGSVLMRLTRLPRASKTPISISQALKSVQKEENLQEVYV